ncbi:MAG: hypothetical protein SVU88_01200 [Candidatus Nanohaloarchaea archaeon]|nr:hypothetical protein [Candidatus Nanohaloarchaea archaeon]
MNDGSDHPVYSLARRRHHALYALDEMRRLADNTPDPETPFEDGKGAIIGNVDGPVYAAEDAVSNRIGANYWQREGYDEPSIDADTLPEDLGQNFRYDGALLLGEDGFGEQRVLFDLDDDDELQAFAGDEGWGGRHVAAVSAAQHPAVETLVVSSADGALRYFDDGTYCEISLSDRVPPPPEPGEDVQRAVDEFGVEQPIPVVDG